MFGLYAAGDLVFDAPTISIFTRMSTASQNESFLGKFLVLRWAPRELWLVFLIKFLAVAAYKVTNVTLVLWLMKDLGFGDKSFQYVAIWSSTMSVMTLLVGSLADAIGFRRTFFLGVWICILSRAVMVFATDKWLALCCGLFPLAVGEALTTPVLVAAVRRFATTRQRSISFSLFYTIMNLGFLVAGYMFDILREQFGEYGRVTLPVIGVTLTTYRVLFLTGLVIEALILPVLYWMRSGAEMTDEGLKIVPEQPRFTGANPLAAFWLTVADAAKSTGRLLKGLVEHPGFYRLLGFLLFIAFLKLIFMQIDYVYPTFAIREIGEGAKSGRLSSLNNWLILFFAPLIGVMTQKYSAYRMVVVGGVLSAVSVFMLALPTAWFEPMAQGMFGRALGGYLNLSGAVHPYYVMSAWFILILSLGEAFYSPRVYEYAASIAPKGQEASYSALSYVPLLVAKLIVGGVTGPLLEKFCPETGVRNSALMWTIVGCIAAVSPVGLLVLRKFIRVKEAGRD